MSIQHDDTPALTNKCPACNAYDKPKGGVMIKKKGKFGDFLGCSRFPKCKMTKPLPKSTRKKKKEKNVWYNT